MDVQVLGTGCARCKKLFAEAEKAVAQAGPDVRLTKVEKIEEILAFGVMMTPALVIDGQVKCSGQLPKAAVISTWIAEARK